MNNHQNYGPPPYTILPESHWHPPNPSHPSNTYTSTESTPLLRGSSNRPSGPRIRRLRSPPPTRRSAERRGGSNHADSLGAARTLFLLVALSPLLIFSLAIAIPIIVSEYESKINDILNPENIRLRNELWMKEEKDHEDVKASWARQELHLKEDYMRSEIEWEKKTGSLRKEHERLKDMWNQEHERYRQDKHHWEAEREAEKKRRKENERRRLGITWEPPFGHECVSYGTRPYNAKLMNVPPGFDGIEACGEMPIVFHGRTIERPQRCERLQNGEVQGHWMVDFDEPLCQPYWTQPEDKGCEGYRSGLRRWEARLMNLEKRESWSIMCNSAPNTIDGQQFRTPTHCEDRGTLYGMIGIFEVTDPNCN